MYTLCVCWHFTWQCLFLHQIEWLCIAFFSHFVFISFSIPFWRQLLIDYSVVSYNLFGNKNEQQQQQQKMKKHSFHFFIIAAVVVVVVVTAIVIHSTSSAYTLQYVYHNIATKWPILWKPQIKRIHIVHATLY